MWWVEGKKKIGVFGYMTDRLHPTQVPGGRWEEGKAWDVRVHLGGQIWRPPGSEGHTLWKAGLWWPCPRDALLGLGVSPFDPINLHPNLPPALHAVLSRLPEPLVFYGVGRGMGVKELWLTCGALCLGPLLSLTDFSLFLFSCLSTQAMQVKVQVKCMTCLFCPSIRGARLWPPSALWSPWGWYRMDLPTWRSPGPASGKTTACQRVNVGPTHPRNGEAGEASQASPYPRSPCYLCSLPQLPTLQPAY